MKKPKCESCGSDDIHMNLLAFFDTEKDSWIVAHFATQIACNVCCRTEHDNLEELLNKEIVI